MIVSIYGIDGHPQYRDPSRIASQVVSGIGFLGAGTILHEGMTVKGLTTAASLWIVSAIGLTVGCGMLSLGVVATVITLITLMAIRGLEKKVLPSGRAVKMKLAITSNNNPDSMMDIMDYLQAHNVKTRVLDMSNNPEEKTLRILISAKISRYDNANDIIDGLHHLKAVKSVKDINSIKDDKNEE
jgi:putative Mg2+ transporter-C (MgtC) family protein